MFFECYDKEVSVPITLEKIQAQESHDILYKCMYIFDCWIVLSIWGGGWAKMTLRWVSSFFKCEKASVTRSWLNDEASPNLHILSFIIHQLRSIAIPNAHLCVRSLIAIIWRYTDRCRTSISLTSRGLLNLSMPPSLSSTNPLEPRLNSARPALQQTAHGFTRY